MGALVAFFPMLVNTIAALRNIGAEERILMRSFAATSRQTFFAARSSREFAVPVRQRPHRFDAGGDWRTRRRIVLGGSRHRLFVKFRARPIRYALAVCRNRRADFYEPDHVCHRRHSGARPDAVAVSPALK